MTGLATPTGGNALALRYRSDRTYHSSVFAPAARPANAAPPVTYTNDSVDNRARGTYVPGDGDNAVPVRAGGLDYKRHPSRGFK